MSLEFVKFREIIIMSKQSWLNLNWITDIFKFFIIIIIFIFCVFFWIFWAFWILETCFIFIEFYFFIILFFIIIICLFTLYFFKCIIILIVVRKNNIYLIQIKYYLSHFQIFFLTCIWMMFLLTNFLWSKLLIFIAFFTCSLKYSEHKILSSQ